MWGEEVSPRTTVWLLTVQVVPSSESASCWGVLVTECSTDAAQGRRGLFSHVSLRRYHHHSVEGMTFSLKDHAKWLVTSKETESSAGPEYNV